MGLSGKGKRTGGKKVTGPKKPAAKAPKKSAAKQAAPKKGARKKAAPQQPQTKKEGGAWAAVFTPRTPGERRYWLVKSEPETFSFDDLLSAANQTTHWDGVRNFAARNFMRDGMKLGDQVFFYHSSVNPQAIVGICEVVREAYPDSTAFDSSHHGYDADSDPDEPTWVMVDLRAVERLARPVTLTELKAEPRLAGMALLRIGRLSVTPVTAAEWDVVRGLAGGG
jgi:predicted RNA-binding protein with PUA-like domain